MALTPVAPAPTRLAGDLERAREILARLTTAQGTAGPGARAFTRTAITVTSPEAVDALAAQWHVPARWTKERTQYVAWFRLGHEAEAEAVYYAPAPAENGAAA